MHLTTLLWRAARINPRGLATEHLGVTRTWKEVDGRVTRLAGAYSMLGLGEGDGLAILSHNSDRYLEALFSIFAMGGVAIPLNTRFSAAELAYCIDHSGARVLMVDSAHAERAGELSHMLRNPPRVVMLDGSAEEPLSHEGLAQRPGAPAPIRRDADALAGIFYTGGTTGRSKGVMLSHGNLVNNALNLQPYFRFSPQTRCLHVAPMFHIAESLSIFGVTMAAGQHLFLPKFDALAFLEKVQDSAASFSGLVPTMIKRVVEHERFDEFDLTSLQSLFYGGSPILQSDLRRAVDALPHVDFVQGYGLTETSPTITVLEPEHHREKAGGGARTTSVGRPVCSVEVAILDEDGQPLPDGRSGEICVRGGTVMKGYFNDPSATADAMHGEWFRTGDIGRIDENGFLYVIDRAKDMIISGGENVYCIEVENVISQHPDVVECAVIGLPDAAWGERVHAVVRLRPGGTRGEDILAHCKSNLTGYKCPRSIEVLEEPLPLSAVGKISKKDLKAQRIVAAPQEKGLHQ